MLTFTSIFGLAALFQHNCMLLLSLLIFSCHNLITSRSLASIATLAFALP
jgi:hypothetical protein